MLVNVLAVLKNSDITLSFDKEVIIDSKQFEHEQIAFNTPVKVVGNVKNIGGVLILTAKVISSYDTVCSRCMKTIKSNLEFDFQEEFVKNSNIEDYDAENILADDNIDLSDVIIKNVFSNLPLKHLCSPECKGICEFCGQDLNLKECNCKDDEWNPQFEVLKNLFD